LGDSDGLADDEEKHERVLGNFLLALVSLRARASPARDLLLRSGMAFGCNEEDFSSRAANADTDDAERAGDPPRICAGDAFPFRCTFGELPIEMAPVVTALAFGTFDFENLQRSSDVSEFKSTEAQLL
jgi:hypothetical protein